MLQSCAVVPILASALKNIEESLAAIERPHDGVSVLKSEMKGLFMNADVGMWVQDEINRGTDSERRRVENELRRLKKDVAVVGVHGGDIFPYFQGFLVGLSSIQVKIRPSGVT